MKRKKKTSPGSEITEFTTIRILVVATDGSKEAVAAFSSEAKMKAYLEESELEEPKFDFFELGKGSTVPKFLYAAHRPGWTGPTFESTADRKPNESDSSEKNGEDSEALAEKTENFDLAGYYEGKYEAITAAGKGGLVNILKIDPKLHADEEEESDDESDAVVPYGTVQTERPDLNEEVTEDGTRIKAPVIYKKGARRATVEVSVERKKRGNTAFIVLIIAWIAIFYYLAQNDYSVDFAENASAVEWLPKEATDISYYKSKRVVTFEFKCTPAVFVQWAKNEGYKVQDIDSPIYVPTYRKYASIEMPELEDLDEESRWERYEELSNPEIEKGFYVAPPEGKEETLIIAYDALTQRGYYWSKGE